jgi:hypothetical protein
MLSFVAAVSGLYDVLLGVVLLAGRDGLARVFSTSLPTPPIHADLNGVFLIAIGIGYALPWRDPVRYRAYLWIMGPLLKGVGAATFIIDHVARNSPAAYLTFAASDGVLAIATLAALVASRGVPSASRAESRQP